jgi:7-keto-8-aminopelargonate synthetase-like enzyme
MVHDLEEAGYQVRYTNFRVGLNDPTDTYALRISTHLFHDKTHVDGLVAAMHDIYTRMVG